MNDAPKEGSRKGGAFRSLKIYNYRVWAAGALVSNIGTWVQRIAQDWLVLTVLTPHNATAVGFVMALQFGPQLALLPFTGYAADHFDRRKLLFATQGSMGVLALALAILTITGKVELWHVYALALGLGCVAAFDAPARQAFVSELVGETELQNAVALNSTSFHIARMIGPAVAGYLIQGIGFGGVFLINAGSFAAVIGSLLCLRKSELHTRERAEKKRGSLMEGFRYVWARPDLRALMLMFFLVGTFGLNFPIFISTMSVKIFHVDAGGFGQLTSLMAIGSVAGALLAAKREKPRMTLLMTGAAVFGLSLGLAAIMPGYWLFGAMLTVVGISAQTFSATALGAVQMSTEPKLRGRVMALVMAIAMGCTPLGAPIVGWVADVCGPPWALGIGAAAGLGAAAVAARFLVKYRNLKVSFNGGRLQMSHDEELGLVIV